MKRWISLSLFVSYMRDVSVSSKLYSEVEMFTIIRVLAFPPRESCITWERWNAQVTFGWHACLHYSPWPHRRDHKQLIVHCYNYHNLCLKSTKFEKYNAFFMTCVSLLFLYGTWGSSADKAEITSPRALRDLLMELASWRGEARRT